MNTKLVKILKCKRCGHEWARRIQQPLRCPLCKNSHWNKPRIVFDGTQPRTVKGAHIPTNSIEQFKKSYRNKMRRAYARKHVLNLGGGVAVCGLNKRPHPGHCETCGKELSDMGKIAKLEYHHWDSENLSKGIWLCSQCHRMAERVDAGYHLVYLDLRRNVQREYEEREPTANS